MKERFCMCVCVCVCVRQTPFCLLLLLFCVSTSLRFRKWVENLYKRSTHKISSFFGKSFFFLLLLFFLIVYSCVSVRLSVCLSACRCFDGESKNWNSEHAQTWMFDESNSWIWRFSLAVFEVIRVVFVVVVVIVVVVFVNVAVVGLHKLSQIIHIPFMLTFFLCMYVGRLVGRSFVRFHCVGMSTWSCGIGVGVYVWLCHFVGSFRTEFTVL